MNKFLTLIVCIFTLTCSTESYATSVIIALCSTNLLHKNINNVGAIFKGEVVAYTIFPFLPSPDTTNYPWSSKNKQPNIFVKLRVTRTYKVSLSRQGVMDIHVEKKNVPLLLVLTAHHPTLWQIHTAKNINLQGAVISGVRKQEISGLPRGV